MIDRLRILAVRPEPAEPAPGDVVSFEALIVDPQGDPEMTIWFGCLSDEAEVMGCLGQMDLDVLEDLDPAALEELDPEEMAELWEQLVEAGLMGIEPYLAPSYTIPADILDGLSEEERLEGLNLFVQVTAIPQGSGEEEDVAEDDVELAYKRVPVSEARTPNHNPAIAGLRIEGVEFGPDVVFEVDAGQSYRIEPVLADDAIETYEYLNQQGQVEERVEEPYFSFYVEEGALDASYSIHPYGEVEWTAPTPAEKTDQMLWVVMQDRRGGMNWWSQQLRVRE